jgi:hypothetical protein
VAWDTNGKVTRRQQILAEMDTVDPRTGLLALIEPHYPEACNGTQMSKPPHEQDCDVLGDHEYCDVAHRLSVRAPDIGYRINRRPWRRALTEHQRVIERLHSHALLEGLSCPQELVGLHQAAQLRPGDLPLLEHRNENSTFSDDHKHNS